MLIILDAKLAVTPFGNPEGEPIPVAFIVVWVIVGNTTETHDKGEIDAPLTDDAGVTVMLPVGDIIPHPLDSFTV
jgi:hypothetical protein